MISESEFHMANNNEEYMKSIIGDTCNDLKNLILYTDYPKIDNLYSEIDEMLKWIRTK